MVKFLQLFTTLLVCCVTFSWAQGLSLDWVKGLGGGSEAYSGAIATDRDGNVIVVGYYTGNAKFYPVAGTITPEPIGTGRNMILTKQDAAGNTLWVKSIGSISGSVLGHGVTSDEYGNFYVTGEYYGEVDFDPGAGTAILPNSFSVDAFLAKYNKDGNFMWVKKMGGDRTDIGLGVAIDKQSSSIYVAGRFMRIINFETDTLAAVGSTDAFLVKYDSSGKEQWVRASGGSFVDFAKGVAVDNNGDPYIIGITSSITMHFDTLSVFGDGLYYASFFAKYDKEGNLKFARNIGYSQTGNALIAEPQDITADSEGNILVTGYYGNDTIKFDKGKGDTLTLGFAANVSKADKMFLIKYNSEGQCIWVKNAGSVRSAANAYACRGAGIATDELGNIYVSGFAMADSIYFDYAAGKGLINGATNNLFLAKYDKEGNFHSVKNMGGSSIHFDKAASIALDNERNIFLTGSFSNTGDFDPGNGVAELTAKSTTNYDIYFLKLACKDTTSSSLVVNTCTETYSLNDITYAEAGVYTQILSNANGCDSTITIDLSFYKLEPSIAVNEKVLSTTDTFTTYQWMLEGNIISGATNRNYTVSENGNYQVIVTNEEGCSDTSDGYYVNNATSLNNILANKVHIYPNPTSDILHIESTLNTRVSIADIHGQVLLKDKNDKTISLKHLAKGVYFISIYQDQALIKTEKVIVK